MNDFIKGELIEVSDAKEGVWHKKIFVFEHEGFFYCEYSNGRQPLAVWKYARKIKNDLDIDYEGECFVISSDGNIFESTGDNNLCNKTGIYRKTKQLAVRSAENIAKRNRLEELAMWIDPDWKDEDIGTCAWYLRLNNKNTVDVCMSINERNIGQVYMSGKAAETLSEAFNNKELKVEDYL